MRKTSAAVACLAVIWWVGAALAAPAAADPKGSLDGKTFVGEVGEKGKKGEKDTLHFADGRFHSAGCDAYGFADAPYTAALASDGSVTWTAETSSSKEGKISWTGKVKGDKLEGTYVWAKPGQAPIDYWIKATEQK
jgi:hypothetical protein